MPSRGENTPERGREEGRSRKCLQLSLKKGEVRGLPLVETGNLPPSPHRTPNRSNNKPMGGSRGDVELYLSSSPSHSPPSPTPSNVSIIPPSVLPKTPLRLLTDPIRRKNLALRSTNSPHMRTPVRQSPKRKREEEELLRSQEKERREAEEKLRSEERKQPVEVKPSSFYSAGKPIMRTPELQQMESIGKAKEMKSKAVRSLPAMPRASSKKRANSARRSGGGGGGRRRSSAHRGVTHGGHGIKKPKHKPSPFPALKISDLPAMSIELPNSSRNRSEPHAKEVVSAPATPSIIPSPSAAPSTTPGTPSSSGRKAGTTPSGQINLTPRTKVQFEVKAGNFVYRAKAKAGITPRRSPRKHAMSPLKAEYFRGKKTHANMFCSSSNSEKKPLFSPEAKNNFLGPSASQEMDSSAAIPSPVKFHDSSQDTGEDCSLPDLSGILASLNNTSADGNIEKEVKGETKGNEEKKEPTSMYSLSGELSLRTGTQEEGTLQKEILAEEDEAGAARLAMEATVQLWGGGEEASNFEEATELQYSEPVASSISNILNDLSSGESDISQSSQSEEEDARMPSLVKANTDSRLYPIFYKESARSTGETGSTPQQEKEKRFLCSSLPANQAYIDAGQKELGATLCQTCGSVYSKGDPQDEAMHNIQHTGLLERLKHQGWTKERVVATYPEGGRVISIRPGDDARWWKKAEDVLGIVDRDLGFSEVGIRAPDRTKIFLFVADKKIVGLLLAEQISQGFQIIPPTEGDEKRQVYCCSETPQPVLVGISRIWVLADYRRKGVASYMVDCMRVAFFVDKYLAEKEFAFSDPTLNGIEFASKYTGHKHFLVYNR